VIGEPSNSEILLISAFPIDGASAVMKPVSGLL
jgi:hypothetical protein